MNNYFFGKEIENKRRRQMNLELIDKSDTHRFLNRQPKCYLGNQSAKLEKFNLYSFKKRTAINIHNLSTLDLVY